MLTPKNVLTPMIALVTALLAVPALAHAAGHPLKVVTTVAPLTNIVANVSGGYAHVTGIVPEGVNSHTFEPVPSDARLLHDADVIIVNGLHLETLTVKLADKVKRPTTPIVHLGRHTIRKDEWRYDFSFPKSGGNPNPHLWMDVAYAMRYAEIARDTLARMDPAHRDAYYANTTAYLAKLSKLDGAIFDCIRSIPPKQRKLVTYHDSFAYFAPRYGMQVIAAVQPSDFSEPRPQDVVAIINQLKRERVPAIFGSVVFPSKVLKQISRESGTRYVNQLADDELPGKPGAPQHTYMGMMARDVRLITGALGGDAQCMAGVDVSNLPGTR
ncbi:MAG TPA: metal ABC transporter substrate-binding protein [Gammaproteobacteria bacterium]|nr:metal ABC transporter substrate-binding protein [Gammaproteobacteria bacterium]